MTMEHIDVWRMAVDLGLITAILVMAFRYMKGSRAQALLPRTLELESSLRSLIGEADAAGRHLNEQLLRREQNLQKLLGEIEALEQRVTRSVASAEERSTALGTECEKAKTLADEFRATVEELTLELTQQLASSVQEQPVERVRPRATSKARRTVPQEPPAMSFEEVVVAEPEPPRASQAATARQYSGPAVRRKTPSDSPLLLLSEEVELADAKPQPQAPKPKEDLGHAELRKVYATAESLLKEGQRVEQVSAQTRLPVEELHLLSQMIEIEREEESKKQVSPGRAIPTDPRLGALGAIRRPMQNP